MKKLILTAVIAIALTSTGCSVKKDWGSNGGSKSDGTVKLSYTHGLFEKPVLNAQQGQDKAVSMCKRWGFGDAEAFDFVTKDCTYLTRDGCMAYKVTKEFQCLD